MTVLEGHQIILRPSGEIIDVREAETEELARADEAIADLDAELKETRGIISGELVARLDRAGQWTMRVGDPENGVQWEIKAPSPAAGSTAWDVDELEDTLADLVATGLIDPSAAAAALKRTVVVVFELGAGDDVDELVTKAKQDERVAKVETARAPVAAGLSRLLKIPAVRDRVAECQREQEPPPRKAKVSVKTRG